jgi:hypothetical protein
MLFTLVFLAIGLGVALSDHFALVRVSPNVPFRPSKTIVAGRIARLKDWLDLSHRPDSRTDNVMSKTAMQDVKQPSQIDSDTRGSGNDSRDTASEGNNVATDHEVLTPEDPAKQAIQKMHNFHADIIKGQGGEKPNKLRPHQARAKPNSRLKVAFRVNNCFTSEIKSRCDDVRREVFKVLQPGTSDHWRDWPELVEVVRSVARAELSDPRDEVNLFDAMQMIVMKTMLKVLFDKSSEDQSKDVQIRRLAKEVNAQWILSKSYLDDGVTPQWDSERQGSLKATAEDIFGTRDADDIHNPFNMILPGYETMWRVVLRLFLELESSRHPSNSDVWKERLALFINNPTRGQLQIEASESKVTAEHLSFEVLRLYPPTRHVGRMHQDEDGERTSKTADIEKLHHEAPIWNNKPMTFKPERWQALEGMNTKGYMPFGEHPFRCPARQHKNVAMPFGVAMIAVLTGCFIDSGISPNARALITGNQALTPAQYAITLGDLDTYTLLVERGADSSMTTLVFNVHALHFAAAQL